MASRGAEGGVSSLTAGENVTCSWDVELEVELGPELTEAEEVERAPVEARRAGALLGEPCWRPRGRRFSGSGGCGGLEGIVTAV